MAAGGGLGSVGGWGGEVGECGAAWRLSLRSTPVGRDNEHGERVRGRWTLERAPRDHCPVFRGLSRGMTAGDGEETKHNCSRFKARWSPAICAFDIIIIFWEWNIPIGSPRGRAVGRHPALPGPDVTRQNSRQDPAGTRPPRPPYTHTPHLTRPAGNGPAPTSRTGPGRGTRAGGRGPPRRTRA